MTTPMQTDRPRFYEQQYLDAADLSALVDYQRIARARHDLGAHSWGIASGLQLIEKPVKSGVDVYLQPGYAWDGLGRPLVVLSPYRIPSELFASIPFTAGVDDGVPPGRLVEVWLQFTATPRGGPADGFEACTADDQSSRLFESFRIVVGERPAHSDRHVPVTVGPYTVDAAQVPQRIGAVTDPLLVDESIAYQTFPGTWDAAQWLVPLGVVRWAPPAIPTDAGSFKARAAADLAVSDQKRRYAGVVAETVDAARGFVRIRPRDAAAYAPTVWNTATDKDLLWVEGNARVQGDAKLLGGRLMLRDESNGDSGGPLAIRRRPVPGLGPLVTDIFAQIGNADAGTNRFVVGPVTGAATPADFKERFVVTAAGRVGIGAPMPTTAPLVIRAQGGSEDLLAFETPLGVPTWKLNTLPGGKPGLNFSEGGADGRLFLQPGGNVGIGTTDPKHRLQVHGEDNALVVVSDAAAGVAANIGIELRTKSASGVSYIDFTKGSTDLANAGTPDFSGRLSFNEANTGAFSLRGGRLGIETTTPTNRVHIEGNLGLRVNRIYTSGGAGNGPSVWSSLSFNAHHDEANAAWVFPDPARRAVTIEMDDTGGVPRFDVWSTTLANTTGWVRRVHVNGDSGDVVMNDFGGRTAIGPTPALCRLHVSGDTNGDADQVTAHVAVIDNRNGGNSADVLALRVAAPVAGFGNNFLTCFAGATAVGSIEGDGIGVSFNTTSADYAEWLPRDEDEPAMQPGDLVGVFAGRLRRETVGADQLLIISTSPALLANTPARDERHRFERVAMLGQVPVRVRGAILAGDVIIPSGDEDGTAIGVAATEATLDDFAMSVGTAWGAAKGPGISLVRCAVGLVSARAWRSVGRALAVSRATTSMPAEPAPVRAPSPRRRKTVK
ncbi:MAG: hypothetical protein IT355_06125 [Gemmatimonadaceae bacterium]|nr:hypothetical protein [Gemmatimonadaceae bacterium]